MLVQRCLPLGSGWAWNWTRLTGRTMEWSRGRPTSIAETTMASLYDSNSYRYMYMYIQHGIMYMCVFTCMSLTVACDQCTRDLWVTANFIIVDVLHAHIKHMHGGTCTCSIHVSMLYMCVCDKWQRESERENVKERYPKATNFCVRFIYANDASVRVFLSMHLNPRCA